MKCARLHALLSSLFASWVCSLALSYPDEKSSLFSPENSLKKHLQCPCVGFEIGTPRGMVVPHGVTGPD